MKPGDQPDDDRPDEAAELTGHLRDDPDVAGPGAQACPECGSPAVQDLGPTGWVQTPDVAQGVVYPAEVIRICLSCGHEWDDG